MNAFDVSHVLSCSDPGRLDPEMERPLYIVNKPITEEALCDWIATAVTGERLQYHQGLLLLDRSLANSSLPSKERQRINAVARRAWRACELGLVHLVSQRLEPFVFRYIAIRSRMIPSKSQIREQLRTLAH